LVGRPGNLNTISSPTKEKEKEGNGGGVGGMQQEKGRGRFIRQVPGKQGQDL